MKPAWSDELTTGIHAVDSQHKNLISKLRNLNDAIENGRGSIEAARAIEFLQSYTSMHFRLEEQYMEKYKYSEADFHIEQHRQFQKTLSDLKKLLNSRSLNDSAIRDVQYELWEYFKIHISVVDAALARFMRQQKK